MASVTVPRPAVATAPDRDPLVRLRSLFDSDSLGQVPGWDVACPESGVAIGVGRVAGGLVVAYATDPGRQGGALGSDGCRRIAAAIDHAAAHRMPVVGLWHSGGARIGEGVAALDGIGRIFAAIVRASGRVPQVSVVLGPAAGGAAYGPALTDIVIMAGGGRVFVTGPDVVRSVTGETVDMESLGGSEAHGQKSGVAHVVAETDAQALAAARQAVTLLGRRVHPRLAGEIASDDLSALLPDRPNRAYDVRPLVTGLLDGPGLELHARWARNIVTVLGRMAGRTVGVIANNPLRLGGCLDSTAAEKAARFVRMCDSFGVPLVVVVDVPGYLPGVRQEWEGIVRRGAKLLHAFSESVVPRVTLVTRKAYGGAYIAMNSRALGATAVFAWPQAQIAVMGARSAVEILHRRRLEACPPEERDGLRQQLTEDHERAVGGVRAAQELGVVDAVIDPSETRRRIVGVLERTPVCRGPHANIPL
jgi:acetyl-CoA/propionyl-CoA carboxylase carboxyl transferase subunit